MAEAPTLPLDPELALAQEALALFAHPLTGPVSLSPVSGGYMQKTWRVQGSAPESLVLQQFSPMYSDYESCKRVCKVQRWFRKHQRDLEIPRQLKTYDKKRIASLRGSYFRLMAWLEHDPPGELGAHEAAAIGEALRRIHLSPLPKRAWAPGVWRPRKWTSARRRTLRFEPKAPAPADWVDYAARLERLAERVQTPETLQGVCHGDPKAEHFLFQGGRAWATIDLEFAHVGCTRYDLGECLRSVIGFNKWRQPSRSLAGIPAACEGYGVDPRLGWQCLQVVLLRLAWSRLRHYRNSKVSRELTERFWQALETVIPQGL